MLLKQEIEILRLSRIYVRATQQEIACRKCLSAGAPFPLQWDAFSCRDAPDFNRAVTRISSIHAGLQRAVDAQAQISGVFAQISLLH
jgi:hypothetical protein